jgi:hypothetical protein
MRQPEIILSSELAAVYGVISDINESDSGALVFKYSFKGIHLKWVDFSMKIPDSENAQFLIMDPLQKTFNYGTGIHAYMPAAGEGSVRVTSFTVWPQNKFVPLYGEFRYRKRYFPIVVTYFAQNGIKFNSQTKFKKTKDELVFLLPDFDFNTGLPYFKRVHAVIKIVTVISNSATTFLPFLKRETDTVVYNYVAKIVDTDANLTNYSLRFFNVMHMNM